MHGRPVCVHVMSGYIITLRCVARGQEAGSSRCSFVMSSEKAGLLQLMCKSRTDVWLG